MQTPFIKTSHLAVHQSSTMLSRPLSFSLQASSSSWLARICRSSSLTRQAMDTGAVLGQPATADASSSSGSWKVKTIQKDTITTSHVKETTFQSWTMEYGVKSYLFKSICVLSLGCGCMSYCCGHGEQSGGRNEERCGQVVHGVAVQPVL